MQKTSLRPISHTDCHMPLDEGFPIEAHPYQQFAGPIDILHRHSVFELGVCHQGSGIFIIEDQVLPFYTGYCSIIPPNYYHIARSTPGTESQWTFLFFDLNYFVKNGSFLEKEQGDSLGISPEVLSSWENPELCQNIEQVSRELKNESVCFEECVSGLILSIFSQLVRIRETKNEKSKTNSKEIERIFPALEQMTNHLQREISIPQLAQACHLSVSQFRRVFYRIIGENPKEYLTKVRIQTAANMIQTTNHSLLDISLQCGFSSLSSFNRHFKKITGSPPRFLRKRG